MKINSGEYTLQDRNLRFDLVDDIDFAIRDQCYFLRGGNGFGKTSFLEEMVIAGFASRRVDYLYIGQDIRTQLYTLRALLSVQGIKVFNADEFELLRLWIDHSRSATVFILDEFDKYFPDFEFIFDWSRAFIHTYVIVTHLDSPLPDAVTAKYSLGTIRFDLIDFDGVMKHIRISKEKP